MLEVEGVFGYDVLVTCLYLRVMLFKLFKLFYWLHYQIALKFLLFKP